MFACRLKRSTRPELQYSRLPSLPFVPFPPTMHRLSLDIGDIFGAAFLHSPSPSPLSSRVNQSISQCHHGASTLTKRRRLPWEGGLPPFPSLCSPFCVPVLMAPLNRDFQSLKKITGPEDGLPTYSANMFKILWQTLHKVYYRLLSTNRSWGRHEVKLARPFSHPIMNYSQMTF